MRDFNCPDCGSGNYRYRGGGQFRCFSPYCEQWSEFNENKNVIIKEKNSDLLCPSCGRENNNYPRNMTNVRIAQRSGAIMRNKFVCKCGQYYMVDEDCR